MSASTSIQTAPTCILCYSSQDDLGKTNRPSEDTYIDKLSNALLPSIPCVNPKEDHQVHLNCHIQWYFKGLAVRRDRSVCLHCQQPVPATVEKAKLILFAILGHWVGESREDRLTRIQKEFRQITREEVEHSNATESSFLPEKEKCLKVYQKYVLSQPACITRFEAYYDLVASSIPDDPASQRAVSGAASMPPAPFVPPRSSAPVVAPQQALLPRPAPIMASLPPVQRVHVLKTLFQCTVTLLKIAGIVLKYFLLIVFSPVIALGYLIHAFFKYCAKLVCFFLCIAAIFAVIAASINKSRYNLLV